MDMSKVVGFAFAAVLFVIVPVIGGLMVWRLLRRRGWRVITAVAVGWLALTAIPTNGPFIGFALAALALAAFAGWRRGNSDGNIAAAFASGLATAFVMFLTLGWATLLLLSLLTSMFKPAALYFGPLVGPQSGQGWGLGVPIFAIGAAPVGGVLAAVAALISHTRPHSRALSATSAD